MKFLSLVWIAAVAPLTLATPAQVAEPAVLAKRAKCAVDPFLQAFINNADSASAFCSSFFIPSATAKGTATSTVFTTSTVKIVIINTTPTTTITSALSTTTVVTTVTASAPVAVKRAELAERDATFPSFVLSALSVEASSACSCILSTITTTAISTKIVSSVIKTTPTVLGTTTVTSVSTVPVVTISSTTTTTAQACPTNALALSTFETSGAPFQNNNNIPGSSYVWTQTSTDHLCFAGNACSVISGTDPAYGGSAIAPISTCPGKTYTVNAQAQVILPVGPYTCSVWLVTRTATGATAQIAGRYNLSVDVQWHAISGQFTADATTVYLSIDINCPSTTSKVSLMIDNVSVVQAA